ncbi:MAG: chemotaxis protein CheX [Planctomycetes bacterium]|nr:chemotaxis protein CheX [Planctomycetota bacterium]
MNELTAQRLAELTAEALERTAFLISDPVETDPAVYCKACEGATIRYRGPDTGCVTLNAGEGFLRTLASNLLGVEPEEVEPLTQGVDAIRELTNIVGGSVVAELGGRDCAYSLGLPEPLIGACPTVTPEVGVKRTCCLDCEGQLLFVTWTPDKAPASLAA